MADLEKAAAEGRVDENRVADSRRKAQDLTRAIDEALKEVKDKAPAGPSSLEDPRYAAGEISPDARTPSDAPPPQTEDASQLATKAGQAAKQRLANKSIAQQGDD